MNTRRNGYRAGFTLVELLVVIGIIAVLISVLLPALSKARGRAQTVACQSNLRQITQACVNYTVEYKGSYPYGFVFNKFNPTTGRQHLQDWANIGVVGMMFGAGVGSQTHYFDHQADGAIDGR